MLHYSYNYHCHYHYKYNHICNYSPTTLHFTVPYSTATTVHYSTLQYTTVHYSTLQYTTVHYSTLQYTTVHYSTLQYTTVHYSTLQYTTVHYSTLQYTTLQLQLQQLQLLLQLQLQHYSYKYTTSTTATTTITQLQLHDTTLHRTTFSSCGWGDRCDNSKKTELKPPFGPSVDSLCHSCITTTHPSYSFLSLKFPQPPCAVLLVKIQPLEELQNTTRRKGEKRVETSCDIFHCLQRIQQRNVHDSWLCWVCTRSRQSPGVAGTHGKGEGLGLKTKCENCKHLSTWLFDLGLSEWCWNLVGTDDNCLGCPRRLVQDPWWKTWCFDLRVGCVATLPSVAVCFDLHKIELSPFSFGTEELTPNITKWHPVLTTDDRDSCSCRLWQLWFQSSSQTVPSVYSPLDRPFWQGLWPSCFPDFPASVLMLLKLDHFGAEVYRCSPSRSSRNQRIGRQSGLCGHVCFHCTCSHHLWQWRCSCPQLETCTEDPLSGGRLFRNQTFQLLGCSVADSKSIFLTFSTFKTSRSPTITLARRLNFRIVKS